MSLQPIETGTSSNEARRAASASSSASTAELAATAPGGIKVIRRNGKLTSFDSSKISIALTKAFLAVEGGQAAASSRVRQLVAELTTQVTQALTRHLNGGGTLHIEDIQDQVELALMRAGEHKVARDYVLYRNERAKERAAEAAKQTPAQRAKAALSVKLDDGTIVPLDEARMRRLAAEACTGLTGVDGEEVVTAAVRDLYDGIPEAELSQALTLAARARIEKEPNYTYVSARLLLDAMRHEALKFLGEPQTRPTFEEMKGLYADYFRDFIHKAAELELVDPKLCLFDLHTLGEALLPERDAKFHYLGLQTMYDRYLIHVGNKRIETPQDFCMRVAMGLAMREDDRESARHRVLRSCSPRSDFTSSDADAVQQRARRVRSSARAATSRTTSRTTCAASFRSPSATTPSSPSGPAAWATTGRRVRAAKRAYIKPAPTAKVQRRRCRS
jgi:ribonucleoside-diphosphate reductase alpha chain